jgi:hypothetical protein
VYEVEYGIVGNCSDSDTGSELRPDLLHLMYRVGGPVVCCSFVFGLSSGSGQTCRHAQNISGYIVRLGTHCRASEPLLVMMVDLKNGLHDTQPESKITQTVYRSLRS